MSPLRYVIIRHDGVAEPHFDLMFETYAGSQLSTWRVLTWPIESATPATRLREHRRLYLEYEGEIAGGRGFVHRVAEGECQVEVGEENAWSIAILTGTTPQALRLRKLDGQDWEIRPA